MSIEIFDRVGNFTSSGISALIKMGTRKMTTEEKKQWVKDNPGSKKQTTEDDTLFQAPGETYIHEKYLEMKLRRGLTKEHSARPTVWGKIVEPLAFREMPIKYKLESRKRYTHPKIKKWTGMPDAVTDPLTDTTGDIKSPYTLKSFCEIVDAMQEGWEAYKEHSPEYYWQGISNCILTGAKNCGIFIYMPYEKDLPEVRKFAAANTDPSIDANWILYMKDHELPYLIEGGDYKDMNELVFPVPKEDKEFLEHRVRVAVKNLNEKYESYTAKRKSLIQV